MNIVYLIKCKITKKQHIYIEETHSNLNDWFCDHLGYFRTKNLNMATGHHYNQLEHSISNMTVTIYQKVRSADWQYRKER